MDRKYKILLVEDKDSLRSVYEEYLNLEGFEVDTAKDGQEALNKVFLHPYDLVLLDIMLPKVDGMEVLKSIKADIRTKNTKVYLLTVLGRDAVIKEGFDLGADGYLIKDKVTPEMIKKEILSALNP